MVQRSLLLFALVIAKAGHQIAILDLEAGHNGEQPAVAPALRLDALQGVLQVRHGHGVHVLAEGPLQLSQLVLVLHSELLALLQRSVTLKYTLSI